MDPLPYRNTRHNIHDKFNYKKKKTKRPKKNKHNQMGILSNTLNASAGSRNNNGEITTAAPIKLLVTHFRIGEDDDEHDPLDSKFLGS